MKLNDTQLSQVDAQIKRLVKTDSYYGKKYRELGITDVTSQEAFEELPFSSKDDLRNAYPLGIQAVPDEEVVRIHSSSGTTGKPVIIPYTAKDVDDWAIMFARCYETAGVTKKDRVHITPGYGLWTAGIGFQAGCEKLGAMAVPMGPGNTDKQIQMMNAIGLQNPGLDTFVKRDIPFLKQYDTKIIVNVCGKSEADYVDAVEKLGEQPVDLLIISLS